jgi:hypothetical protein
MLDGPTWFGGVGIISSAVFFEPNHHKARNSIRHRCRHRQSGNKLSERNDTLKQKATGQRTSGTS